MQKQNAGKSPLDQQDVLIHDFLKSRVVLVASSRSEKSLKRLKAKLCKRQIWEKMRF